MKFNIRIILFPIVLIGIGYLLASSTSKPSPQIGYINVRSLLQKLPEFKAALTTIDSASRIYQAELKAKTDEYNQKLQAFQAIRGGDTTIVRLRQKELDSQRLLVTELQQVSSQSLQRLEAAMLTPLYMKIKDAARSAAERGGYTHVLNDDAAPELLIYSSQSSKLDSAVWQLLKQERTKPPIR